MKPIDFPEANRTFVKPESMTDQKCQPLPIQDTGEELVSLWRPDDQERARLAAGAPIRLSVVGRGHPPVRIEAGESEPGRLGFMVGEDVRLEVLDTRPGDVVVVTLRGAVPPEVVQRLGALLGEKLKAAGVVGLAVSERDGAASTVDGMSPDHRARLFAAVDAWRAQHDDPGAEVHRGLRVCFHRDGMSPFVCHEANRRHLAELEAQARSAPADGRDPVSGR